MSLKPRSYRSGFSLPPFPVRADDGRYRPATRDRDMLALSHALVGLSLFGPLVFSAPVWAGDVLSVEVFTESKRPVNGANHKRLRAATVTTYAVDGLQRFESRLSEGLPTYAEAAKVEAIERFQQLDSARMAPPKNAAFGLVKAVRMVSTAIRPSCSTNGSSSAA